MLQLPICRRMAAQCVAAILSALVGAGAAAQALRTETVADGLVHPWAVAFLPQGRFIVTERPGRMRVVEPDGTIGPPLANVPEVVARDQGGLLDVILDSDFQQNRTVYFCFAEPGQGGASSTAMARARLSEDRQRLEDVRVIFSARPKVQTGMHFGCRIVESRDGNLFLGLGERFDHRADAQQLGNHHGKVIRVSKDGSVPRGNPFIGREGALPEIWSYGHRNIQGATLAPDGTYWIHEHGPQGGDEVNIPRAGANYGWPLVSHGERYGGGPVGTGRETMDGVVDPVFQWTRSIAPSGMTFLTSDRYGPGLRGDIFIGSLVLGSVVRLEMDNGRVVREHRHLKDLPRVRDVAQGPDGWLYLLTDEPHGRLLRIRPAS